MKDSEAQEPNHKSNQNLKKMTDNIFSISEEEESIEHSLFVELEHNKIANTMTAKGLTPPPSYNTLLNEYFENNSKDSKNSQSNRTMNRTNIRRGQNIPLDMEQKAKERRERTMKIEKETFNRVQDKNRRLKLLEE